VITATVITATAVTAVLVAVAALAAETDAESTLTLPVTVPVVAPQALLRAGPGDEFYPTERLSRDTEVEVWAIDDAGWCAVRPVEGSFSWMRDRDVAAAPDATDGEAAIGVVVIDGAIARIGSRLNPLRHVTQVALEAGERVQVLERVHITEGRHAGDWVRIAPPAGEFRWVAAEDLRLPPELAGIVPEPQEPAGLGLAAAGEALAAIRDAGTAVRQAVAEMNEPLPGQSGPPGLLPDTTAGRLFGGWLPRGTNVLESAPPAAGPPPGWTPPTATGGAAAQSADELADIDLALSLAVAGPQHQWNLDVLRERLRLAATRATSESERTRARAIDARLARFEEIQSRQQALAAASAPDSSSLRLGGMWSSLSALGTRPVRPGVLPGGMPAEGQPTWTPPDQIVTTGRLATVISRRPDAPRWALVDEKNEVLAFVTPQAGLNLAPLVGQEVSVRGAKGYMPEYKRPYLVASDARLRMAAAPPPGITQ